MAIWSPYFMLPPASIVPRLHSQEVNRVAQHSTFMESASNHRTLSCLLVTIHATSVPRESRQIPLLATPRHRQAQSSATCQLQSLLMARGQRRVPQQTASLVTGGIQLHNYTTFIRGLVLVTNNLNFMAPIGFLILEMREH